LHSRILRLPYLWCIFGLIEKLAQGQMAYRWGLFFK
jgi:hypothetical protein